nr:hypothetical protein CFP56_54781 [Quercus suber]
MLPKLPLNIKYIEAEKCTSLEIVSLRPENDFRPMFDLLNCDKFIKNQGYGDLFSTMLRRYFNNAKGPHNYPFYHLIPRSEIPKWFSHQNVGGSVNLQVPSDILGMHDLWCFVGGSRIEGPILSEEYGKIELCQLLLRFYPSTSFGEKWEEILNQVDANGFSQVEVKFEPFGPGLEVTKCGAHLVLERDIEDLINHTKAGPSGEATSNDVDEPHPKRIRLPNLIERLIPRLGNWLGNSSTQEQGDSDCEKEKSQ